MGDKKSGGEARNATPYFFLGVVLLLVGVFLVLQNAEVRTQWHTWRIGSFALPTGIVVVPLLVGIGLWAYKPKNIAGKLVIAAGLLFVLLTLILSVSIHFRRTGLFNYILMFGCIALGLGLMARGYFGGRGGDEGKQD